MNEQVAQWILAAGGWLVAIAALIINYRERKQAREEDRLGKTLDYFGGGSQRRSIGIALIEGLWTNNPKHHDVIVPLVANQIVYLLLSTESLDAHNERNLVRLITIFKSVPNLREKYSYPWGDVMNALYLKLDGEKKGIEMPPTTLRLWQKALGGEADA
jgi:hypothetical protein